MFLRSYYFLGLIIFMMLSCQAKHQDTDALRDEVIAIHDEVMPLMGQLKYHERRLKEEVEQMDPSQESEIKHRQEVIHDLQQAYEEMFVWMRQFQSQQGEMNDEEWEAYLILEKEKVKTVNANIKNALARAKALE